MDKEETERISELLGVDFSQYGITGHWMAPGRAKVSCENCGKPSGLDDFVHTALKSGVHSREHILKAFLDGSHSGGTPHFIDCAVCDTTFKKDGEVCNLTRVLLSLLMHRLLILFVQLYYLWWQDSARWWGNRAEGWKPSDVQTDIM